jgi:hypothetical protein
MILQRTDYAVADLLHSDKALAVVQLEGERMKNMALDLHDRRWGSIFVEATSGEHWLMFAASPGQQGNLVGDVRRWTRQYGYTFHLKLSGAAWPTPRANIFVLPDCREVEARKVFSRTSNFTHWGLSDLEPLPDGWRRLP